MVAIKDYEERMKVKTPFCAVATQQLVNFHLTSHFLQAAAERICCMWCVPKSRPSLSNQMPSGDRLRHIAAVAHSLHALCATMRNTLLRTAAIALLAALCRR